jgi:hypothetical protein
MESIGESAFEYCRELRLVTLPEGLKKVESSAFHNTMVHFPISVGGFQIWDLGIGIDMSLDDGVTEYLNENDESICKIKDSITRVKYMITRLGSPFLLNEELKEEFVIYLRKYWNKLDEYTFLGLLTKKWFTVFSDNEIIVYADANEDTEAVAYLMNFKEEHFGKSSKTYRL